MSPDRSSQPYSSSMLDRTTDPPNPVPVGVAHTSVAALHVVYPDELACRFELSDSPIELGRRPRGQAPPLVHTRVSRKHLAIDWDAQQGTHRAWDLASRNGTAIDGALNHGEPVHLRDGSAIRLGSVLIVYEARRAAVVIEPEAVSQEAIPGHCQAAAALRARVMFAASDPGPVLLLGETGTGKEVIAREIHRLSGRRGPFVPVNCAALAGELIDSELFGHVRGAFSGASQDRPGLFRAAHGGTLMLDEVGELPLSLQAKLLRVLQESEVRPVGAVRALPIDVRVVAATNRDLPAMVEREAFRRDLHARLAMWDIRMPSLLERRADLFLWLRLLYARFAQERGHDSMDPLMFEPEAAEAILCHRFADNLRGLDRLIYALMGRVGSGPIRRCDLPDWLGGPVAAPREIAEPRDSTGGTLQARARPSRDELERVWLDNGGSIRATAKHFGRDRKQIYRWLRAHELDPTRFSSDSGHT